VVIIPCLAGLIREGQNESLHMDSVGADMGRFAYGAGSGVLALDGWTDSTHGFISDLHTGLVAGDGRQEDGGELVGAPAPDGDSGGSATGLGAASEVERLICALDWPCAGALAVARCESGPDYYAAPWENPGHRGAFQLGSVHAWRFTAHGWNWEMDGLVLERNVAVAYEIWVEQGWRPWSCRP